MTDEQLTIEDIRRAREMMDNKTVPKNLGYICPHCLGHIKDGAILNKKWHGPECPLGADREKEAK